MLTFAKRTVVSCKLYVIRCSLYVISLKFREMDYRRVIFAFLMSLPFMMKGQEMEVEKINAMPFDLTASTNKRLDNNGNACALLKVVLPIQDVSFEGNVIGDIRYNAGEYHVYLPSGTKNLRIKHPQKRPLMVSFDDFDVRIEGGQTYHLSVKTEAATESVTFKISPKEAILTVDQKEYPTDNGIAIIPLTPEEHNYTIFAPGYQTQGNKFMVYSGQTNKIIVELDPKDSKTIHTTTSTTTKDLGKPTSLPEQKDNYELTAAQMNEKGEAAYNQENYEVAVNWFRMAAEQGNPDAEFNLAIMYHNGVGVIQDYAEALKRYRQAAMQGDYRAQFNLGYMYDLGEGISRDDSEAMKWYQKSAELGFDKAQFNLGLIYYGYGPLQDYSKAFKWLGMAAEQENSDAQLILGEMYQYGFGVNQNLSEARKWYEKAASQGDEEAKERLMNL